VIVGGGGFAREVAWLVHGVNRVEPRWHLVGFIDLEPGPAIRGVPVVPVDELCGLGANSAVTAIGSPRLRRQLTGEMQGVGLPFATLVHPSVRIDESVRLGAGTVVCAGSQLTVGITIGAHVVVNLDCTIGHNVAIEDYATLSPGCHISGRTTIQQGCFLGTGVVTIEGITIASEATVGAGGVVVRDVPPGTTAIGVPAKPRPRV